MYIFFIFTSEVTNIFKLLLCHSTIFNTIKTRSQINISTSTSTLENALSAKILR